MANHQEIGFCRIGYIGLCDLALNYGGLAASMGAGALMGDNGGIIPESSVKTMTELGLSISGLASPALDDLLQYHVSSNPDSESAQTRYTACQLERNIFAGALGYFIVSFYQNHSIAKAGIGTAAIFVTLFFQYLVMKSRNQLDNLLSNNNPGIINEYKDKK